jgi:hypothetical protein
MDKKQQTQTVLDYLETGQTLTSTQARCKFDIHRLASRISTLRKAGNMIYSSQIGGGFVKYEMDDSAPYENELFTFLTSHLILDEYIAGNESYNYGRGFKLHGDPKEYLSKLLIWPDVDAWTIYARDWVFYLEAIQTTQSHV